MTRGCACQREHGLSFVSAGDAHRQGNDDGNEDGGEDRLDARHCEVDLGGLL